MALFLINRKQNSRPQNIWTIVLGFIAVSMTVIAFFWYSAGNYSLFYKLDILDYFATLSFIPMIFIYFREVTGDKGKWTKLKTGLLFTPPVLLGSVVAVVYLLMGSEQAAAFSQNVVEDPKSLPQNPSLYYKILFVIGEYLYTLFILMQAVYVFIYAFRRLLLYRNRLNDFFSDIEDKDLEHHWSALWGLFALLLFTFVIALSGYMQYIEYDIWVSIIPVIIGICIFYICYHVSLSRYTAESFAKELVLSDEKAMLEGYGNPGEDEVLDEGADNKNNIPLKFLIKFNQVIDEDKIFLQKKLRVDDVATLVGTNRTYISRILKDEYNCDFWEFINRKRIEYAKEQALQNPELTIDDLARICGFSHDSTFSRTFRQCEEITFKEWRKKSSEGDVKL